MKVFVALLLLALFVAVSYCQGEFDPEDPVDPVDPVRDPVYDFSTYWSTDPESSYWTDSESTFSSWYFGSESVANLTTYDALETGSPAAYVVPGIATIAIAFFNLL